jgi:hypothetical protein
MKHLQLGMLISLGCWLGSGLVGCNSSQLSSTNPTSVTPATTSPAAPVTTTTPSAANTDSSTMVPAKPAPTATETDPKDTAAAKVTQQSAASRPPLTLEKLKNAEYYFLAKGPIRLTQGTYEDKETKRTYQLSDVVTYGDINKDGIKDAVTALTVTIPNQGNFSYLVALANEAGSPQNISTEFIGSGIKVKSLKVNPDNSIEAVMDQYQAGDPDCCPSLKITRTYKLKNNPKPAS